MEAERMSTDVPERPEAQSSAGRDARTLGMALLLASLSMLFIASLLGYVVTRARAEAWPPEGAPPLPMGLWLSTGVILLASFVVHTALRAAGQGEQRTLIRAIVVTTVLAILFLVIQTLNWMWLFDRGLTPRSGLYGFLFYLLTALHAAHVVGGLVPLVLVTVRAAAGRYTAREHGGVRYCAVYQHFLAVVWTVVFVAVFLTS